MDGVPFLQPVANHKSALSYFVMTIGAVGIALGCSHTALHEADLAGNYVLVVGSNQKTRRHVMDGFESEELRLLPDGEAIQHCVFHSAAPYVSNGRWRLVDGRTVALTALRDCAGFLNQGDAPASVNLVVEMAAPPVLLFDPDINVFYKRR